MIDRQLVNTGDALNTYNVAQLHLALTTQDSKVPGITNLPFDFHSLSGAASPVVFSTPATSDGEFDYTTRRMSSSAASDSSFQEKDLSPSTSPAPKKARVGDPLLEWSRDQEDHRSRVQLPSITSTFQDTTRRASLPALHSERLRLPNPRQYPFSETEDRRPRLAADTQLGTYPDYSVPSTALSSNSSFSFPGNSPLSGAPSSAISVATDADNWASGIVRPSSTPNQVPGALLSPKYDDSLRHSNIGSQALYGGLTRISGHSNASSDRSTSAARNGILSSVKSEADWNFSANTDLSSMNPPSSMSSSTPSIAVSSSPQRSPPQPQPPTASLADRPPRKRGKLPKPVTDFLKDWLHRHSDHPYPSEEEKKQLCHATGLSMSQVSNWMINARRRILAPAQRGTTTPTTNQPYATRGPSVLDSGRRSLPSESLQLYHPLTLQSLSEPHMSSTRQMVGLSRSMSTNHSAVGSLSSAGSYGHHPYLDSSYATARLSYSSGTPTTLHPSQHTSTSSSYLGVPMSAPGSLSNSSYASHYGNSGSSYSGRGLVAAESGARYTFPDAHAQSVSPQPGSGYHTPQ